MLEVSLQEVETYVSHHQNTVSQFISARPIMYLCHAAEWRPGPWVSRRRWEQEGVDVEGMRMADQEEERTDKEEDMDGTATEMGK